MAKRKSLNKLFSRYSRSSVGSNVLNPDTNVFDEEEPCWWRNLENNTIAIPFTDSTNLNQTSRRLNPNSASETNLDLDDGWWKVLEGTPRNPKSLQKSKDLSKKDANDGATSVSESEEEVKIAKKKPHLRPESKNVDGNAFLCALKVPKIVLIPVEKSLSIEQRRMSSMRMSEHGSDLFNCPLPNATSTPLERSIASHETSVGNSNSDTEPVLKKMKLRGKLLGRQNIGKKKNLFENILMEDKTGEEEAPHQLSANASAVVDKTAKEPESRIVEDESKLDDANKKLHPTKKADRKVSGSNSSDTSHDFFEPMKPKSRFLRQKRETHKENLFRRIISDSDSSTKKDISNRSQNRNSTRGMGRASVISAESTEDLNLRMSSSSNLSDVDIIRTGNKVSSSPNRHVEIASSQPEDRISNAVKTSGDRSILSNQEDKDVSRYVFQTELYSDSDEEENGKASDITLLTSSSKSPSVQSRSTVMSDIILKQPEIRVSQQSQKNSAADEGAVAILTQGSVEIKDTAVAENADDASDIEFRDLNRSRKRLMSSSARDIAAEETAMSTMKSKKYSNSINLNEDKTRSEAESSPRSPLRRQSKRSTTAQQRISFTENDKQTHELDNTTPRRSNRFESARGTSETENMRTPRKDSRDVVKNSKLRDSNKSQKRSMAPSAQDIAAEESELSTMKSLEHSRLVNLSEDRSKSEAEASPRSPLRRQSKRSSTAQKRISFTEGDEKTREVDNTTPRRSKRFESARGTSETENMQTPRKHSRDVAKNSKFRDFNKSQKRSMSRSAQVIEAEKTQLSTMESLEHSRLVNLNEDRSNSEAEASPRSPLRRQSKRSSTAQQRISFTEGDEKTHEPDDTTPRRSKRFESARGTSETENMRTPKKHSRDVGKDNKSHKRSTAPSAQVIAAEETQLSTMESLEHSRSENLNEDRLSSGAGSSPRSPLRRQSKRSTTAKQRISFTEGDEKTHEVDNTTPRRSKRFQSARGTSETENMRTPRKDSRDVVKDNKLRDFNKSHKRSTAPSAQVIAAEETQLSTMESLEHSRSENLNEDRLSSGAGSSPRSPLRRQSKRSTTAKQRISFTEGDEKTHEPDNTTPRRSKRSGAAQGTFEMENRRTPRKDSRDVVKDSKLRDFNKSHKRSMAPSAQVIAAEETQLSTMESLEHSRSENLNEDRLSSEAGSSPRSPLRRQSKRSTTAKQRISYTEGDEKTQEPDNTTPRRSKRSGAAKGTFEMENRRTPRKDSRDVAKDSKLGGFNKSQKRSMPGSAQDIAAEETELSTMESLEHSRLVNLNEDRSSSEAESSTGSPLGRQSKRSTTAQQRISFTESDKQTHEPDNTTPRRSKRSEAAQGTFETENGRTPRKDSRVVAKDSKLGGFNKSQKRSMPGSAQDIAAEETELSTMKSKKYSNSVNLNEDRSSSEAESSTRSPLQRQSERSTTAQQRISFTENDEKTQKRDDTTPRRSKRSEAVQGTFETENGRTPRKDSRDVAKDSKLQDFNKSDKRSMPGSAQDIAAEESELSTMKSLEHSRLVNLSEDRSSSEAESSPRSPVRRQSKHSTTVQQRISFSENDEQTRVPDNTTPMRSKSFESARGTSDTEDFRTPENTNDVGKDSELEGALQSQRLRQNLLETSGSPPSCRPGSSKVGRSTAPQRKQKVLEDFFKPNETGISASQALSNPEIAQEIRKKLDEIKKQELQKMEEKQLVVEKKNNKMGKGLRPQSKKQNSVPKKVDKAYLVNGVVYKRPRLPRPKKWVTDHLYRYLWKKMEPKYKLDTRVKSEKFVCRLCEVTDVIRKCKTYPTYKNELVALMKEMARLEIIQTRHDFYIFCQDFLPYELRVKMVPILLPGNQRTIPFDPNKLFTPLSSSP